MIINTVGRIILKDGKLVFERFGAAVVQKIKLGTAAFANIVNNATTTEEGFVPDARVVAQQQETISALQEQVDSLNSAMGGDYFGAAHNSIWRGKDITDQYYNGYFSEQVAAQTFKDIYPGDYIIGQDSGRKYRVGDINYRLHCGNVELTTPHVLMFPENSMYTAQMNSSNVVTGAYIGSAMYTSGLNAAKTTIRADFGTDHIVSHTQLFTNAVVNGYASSGAWVDRDIDLMNECMVYGSHIMSPANYLGATIPYRYTIDKSQIAAFRLCPEMIVCLDYNGNRTNWWLRDAVSSVSFAAVTSGGSAYGGGASGAFGVRPAFLIK